MLLGTSLLPLGCSATEDEAPGTVHVLFIGNSLTETNDLPETVAALARAGGHAVEVASVVADNYSLEDHWANGGALRALEARHWDFVVLQQGPSSLPANQQHLRRWATRFADAIRGVGATPALYTVWPAAPQRGDLPVVIASYAAAADTARARLLPAGAAWAKAWAQTPALALYGPDNFHPSPLGSFLAALTLYGGLFDADPRSLPPSVAPRDLGITDDTVRMLQAAAAEALAAR